MIKIIRERKATRKMVKLVCTDVDGTLVKDGTFDLNKEYYDEVIRLKEKGIHFCVASGRPYSSIKKLFAPVLKDIYIICDNGACVLVDGKPVYMESIDRDKAMEIICDIENIDECHTYVSCVNKGYVDKSAMKLYDWLVNGYRIDMELIEKMPDNLPEDDDILCIEMYHETQAEKKALDNGICEKWGNGAGLRIGCAGKQWMHINSEGADKGQSLMRLGEILGVKYEEIMVFGDNINDLGMLEKGYYSYAIGNARDEVKEKARFVADTNINDGVLKVIKTL